MANAVVNLDIRPRREPIEAVTTKLLYQRQAFVQYIPKVHKLHLGIDVDFPHRFNAQTPQRLDNVASIKFDPADIEAITENIRRMHYLAVTKYENIDPDFNSKPMRREARLECENSFKPRPLYDGLSLRSREIRVLNLLPGHKGTPIQCDLFTANSVQEIEYEALSYVWGDESIRESITVNNKKLSVTKNLYDALHSIRHSDRAKLLWTDAICIDQQNVRERNVQVAMMGEIYLAAKTVNVYLGEANTYTEFLLRMLEEYEDPQATPDSKIFDTPNWPVILEYMTRNHAQIFQSLVSIMSRPWFSRMWIFQEFHLATRQPRVYVGSHNLSASIAFGSLFGLLMESCGHTTLKTREILQPLLNDKYHASLNTLPQNYIELKRKAVLCRYTVQTNDMLPRFPAFWLADPAVAAANCTDKRDKIFGISGMFDPISKAILEPDYTLCDNEVFMRTTAWVLMMDDVAFYTFFRYHLLRAPDYPSWVLDFGKPLPYDDIDSSTKVDQDKVFPDKDPLARYCIVHQQVLYIEGIEITTISKSFDPLWKNDVDTLAQLWRFEKDILQYANDNPLSAAPFMANSHRILAWTMGDLENLISFLVPHCSLFSLVLLNALPDFPENPDYPPLIASQDLLGALLFDGNRFLEELYDFIRITLTESEPQSKSIDNSPCRYKRLLDALLRWDIRENARVLRIVYDFFENMVPIVYREGISEAYLDQQGFSATDPHVTAQTFVDAYAAEGKTITEADAFPLANEFTNDHANKRCEQSQRLLKTSFFMTTSGVPGCGPEGVHGFEEGDKIVFFRKMPVPVAIRPCKDDSSEYRLVGIVQMKGLIDGSLYERPEIKEGKPRLFTIR